MTKATQNPKALTKALLAERDKRTTGRCVLCGIKTTGSYCYAHSDLAKGAA